MDISFQHTVEGTTPETAAQLKRFFSAPCNQENRTAALVDFLGGSSDKDLPPKDALQNILADIKFVRPVPEALDDILEASALQSKEGLSLTQRLLGILG